MPVITTLHTVLAAPTAAQRAVMERIVAVSSKVVVMANKARELLRSVYQVPDDKIQDAITQIFDLRPAAIIDNPSTCRSASAPGPAAPPG